MNASRDGNKTANSIDDFVNDIISDIEVQRRGWNGEYECVLPVGEIRIIGRKHLYEVLIALDFYSVRLGIKSIDEMGKYSYLVSFKEGIRRYEFKLDEMKSQSFRV